MIDDDVTIEQLIPASVTDAWIEGHTDDGEAFYQRIAAFALVRNRFGNQEIRTLVLDGSGYLYEPDGCALVYGDGRPDASEKR